MRALTVEPGRKGSLRVTDVPDLTPGDGELLVDGVATGCGTDKGDRLRRVRVGPAGGRRGWCSVSNRSAGSVKPRRGANFLPVIWSSASCAAPTRNRAEACAHGEFDMCRNGRYREGGIKELDGYGSQAWCVESDYGVRLDPSLERVGMLLEPTTVVSKAWEQVERIGSRGWFEPKRALVTGAGPIGLLAALIGVQRGLDTHVLDQIIDGPKPKLVKSLGATYHHEDIESVAKQLRPDVVIEATGVGSVIFGALTNTDTYGMICLTGVSPGGHRLDVDAGLVNRDIVLENDVVVGSVNANLRHYRQAADVLAHADNEWLEGLITRRVPLENAAEAFQPADGDVKVVIELNGRG